MRLPWLLALVAGCSIFSGDDQHTCPPLTDETGAEPAMLFRDPDTGACQAISTGGECTEGCPCPAQSDIAMEEGGECNGPCSSLDETACTASGTCHAAYLDSGSGAAFWGCWDIAPQQPQNNPDCVGLDPFTCSFDPLCESTYSSDANGNTAFESCGPTSCGDISCGSGTHCEQQCAMCDTLNCGSASCDPTCVPDDPEGSCTGTVTCNMAPPACPPNTTAGIANGCYTGYCIPNAQCEPGSCASLTTEAACTADADCEAVYTGTDCTCDESGCTCTTLTFSHCESSVMSD